jgi:hypothetical protein
MLVVDLTFALAGYRTAEIFCWLLAGPLIPLLTLFDISSELLWAIPYVLVVPYWVALGLWSGWRNWKLVGTHRNESGDLALWTRCQEWCDPLLLSLALALFAFLHPLLTGHFINGGPWYGTSIVNNLRQIDAAKSQLAIDRALPEGYQVTEADLLPYLERVRFPFVGRWGERYVLGALDREPYAVVDSAHRIRRRGWTEGYTIRAGTVVKLR